MVPDSLLSRPDQVLSVEIQGEELPQVVDVFRVGVLMSFRPWEFVFDVLWWSQVGSQRVSWME